MKIETLHYADSKRDSVVVSHGGGSITVLPWPCATWHAEPVAAWIASNGGAIPDAPAPALSYAQLRSAAYPSIGDQIDAIAKMAEALRDVGASLPAATVEWLEARAAVKAAYPKAQLAALQPAAE